MFVLPWPTGNMVAFVPLGQGSESRPNLFFSFVGLVATSENLIVLSGIFVNATFFDLLLYFVILIALAQYIFFNFNRPHWTRLMFCRLSYLILCPFKGKICFFWINQFVGVARFHSFKT